MRSGRVFLKIKYQNRDGLDGMAGGFENVEAQSGKIESIAVCHRYEGVFRLRAGPEMDDGAATVAQF